MAKKEQVLHKQRFFNEGTYNAEKLTERLNKAAVKVNSAFKMWYNKSVADAYIRAIGAEMEYYWTDIMVQGYSDCLWNSIYDSKGKTKKAEKAADLASTQFEKNFK